MLVLFSKCPKRQEISTYNHNYFQPQRIKEKRVTE